MAEPEWKPEHFGQHEFPGGVGELVDLKIMGEVHVKVVKVDGAVQLGIGYGDSYVHVVKHQDKYHLVIEGNEFGGESAEISEALALALIDELRFEDG